MTRGQPPTDDISAAAFLPSVLDENARLRGALLAAYNQRAEWAMLASSALEFVGQHGTPDQRNGRDPALRQLARLAEIIRDHENGPRE